MTAAGFAHMTAQLQLIAPCAALLEGGYCKRATAEATQAVARVLLGERPASLGRLPKPSAAAIGAIRQTLRAHGDHWRCISDRAWEQQELWVMPVQPVGGPAQPVDDVSEAMADSDDEASLAPTEMLPQDEDMS